MHPSSQKRPRLNRSHSVCQPRRRQEQLLLLLSMRLAEPQAVQVREQARAPEQVQVQAPVLVQQAREPEQAWLVSVLRRSRVARCHANCLLTRALSHRLHSP